MWYCVLEGFVRHYISRDDLGTIWDRLNELMSNLCHKSV